ncbi:MAG TPA: FUSC family protein, partial [Novosphingobium sp.]|nr:FUSC family protein [Novosphingobium sp.]
RAGWQELATKTQPRTTPQTTAWISRMLDRMVLLGPHVATLGNGDALTCDRLRDIRIGMALDDLQRVGQDAGLRQARRSAVLSARLRKQFLSARKTGVLEVDQTLCRMIERALASANRLPASPAKRSLLLALVGLSRNLSP